MHARVRYLPDAPLHAVVVLWAALVAVAQAQSSPFMTGATALQTNILILRCSGSEHGGTSQFASRLIGEREVTRLTASRSRRATELLGSTTLTEHPSVEAAVMGSEIEQLADLSGYLKLASNPGWQRVRLHNSAPQQHPEPTLGTGRILRFQRASALSPRTARSIPAPEKQPTAANEGFELE